MHILITNDDGPPSAQASPYILPFVSALKAAGHTVSVIIPDTQRSWIGKAHIVGQDVRAVSYWPPTSTPDSHHDSASQEDNGTDPWVLVNSTPAGCAQLGLSHFFQDRGPIELVISGPNYGRNTTAVFALSSGTLGAALEASICGSRAIALSFAFFDRKNEPDVVAEACKQGVRVCEWLATNGRWDPAQLYSVNVPVKKGVLQSKVCWTQMLQNQWQRGACFQELLTSASVDDPATEEAKLRQQEGTEASEGDEQARPVNHARVRHFKWSPRFTDVYESVEKNGPGSDGWAVKEGETSVTALKANFMHPGGFEGELKL